MHMSCSVCVCASVLCTSCLARVSSCCLCQAAFIMKGKQVGWPGLETTTPGHQSAQVAYPLSSPPPSSGVSCIASGRNRFRTFHASSPDQREHATREFAWAKQKPLALSQALFIVNEIAETTTTTTTTRTSRAGPCT